MVQGKYLIQAPGGPAKRVLPAGAKVQERIAGKIEKAREKVEGEIVEKAAYTPAPMPCGKPMKFCESPGRSRMRPGPPRQ